MTPNLLSINFEWLERQIGSQIDREFFADLSLALGDEIITRIDDLSAKTVRNQMRGCAHQLATWFAMNWWRLRWEPEPVYGRNADWRLAHSIAGAGGGYVWPNAIFASDGEYMEISMRPETLQVPYEPIRYINTIFGRTSVDDFEQKIDAFLESIILRADSLKIQDKSLSILWNEVLQERRDPASSQRRKLEALAGYDPDVAPDDLLQALIDDERLFGKNATEELAAGTRKMVRQELDNIKMLKPTKAGPKAGGFRASMPAPESIGSPRDVAGKFPWEKANELAHQVRRQWGLGNKPVSDKKLEELFAMPKGFLRDADPPPPIQNSIGFRNGNPNSMDIYINRRHPTSRRFGVARVLGDHIEFGAADKLIPVTNAKTSRQKFQRSFAQEFLCPIDALLEKIQTENPDENDISEAADYFNVSQQLVTTALVNHGHLDRSALTLID